MIKRTLNNKKNETRACGCCFDCIQVMYYVIHVGKYALETGSQSEYPYKPELNRALETQSTIVLLRRPRDMKKEEKHNGRRKGRRGRKEIDRRNC